jgi:hypothetical protein
MRGKYLKQNANCRLYQTVFKWLHSQTIKEMLIEIFINVNNEKLMVCLDGSSQQRKILYCVCNMSVGASSSDRDVYRYNTIIKTRTKLRGRSPQANYTDRTIAACRRR